MESAYFFFELKEFGDLSHVNGGADGIGGLTEVVKGWGNTSEVRVVDPSRSCVT